MEGQKPRRTEKDKAGCLANEVQEQIVVHSIATFRRKYVSYQTIHRIFKKHLNSI